MVAKLIATFVVSAGTLISTAVTDGTITSVEIVMSLVGGAVTTAAYFLESPRARSESS